MAKDLNRLRDLVNNGGTTSGGPSNSGGGSSGDDNGSPIFGFIIIIIIVGLLFNYCTEDSSNEPTPTTYDNSKNSYESDTTNSYDRDSNNMHKVDSSTQERVGSPKSSLTVKCSSQYSLEDLYYTTNNINVRSKLDSYDEENIMGYIPRGNYVCPIDATIAIVEGDSSKWVLVELSDGNEGWIKGKYMHNVSCMYVGAIKLRARTQLSRNADINFLNLSDKVCSIDAKRYTLDPGDDMSVWFKVVSGTSDNIVGWVNSDFLVEDQVDLTQNLPKQDTFEVLKQRIATYNSTH